MEMQQVRSSNLAAVGYDPESMTLAVRFRNGRLYQYAGVQEARYVALMGATSHGTYFSSFIKDRFPTRRLR